MRAAAMQTLLSQQVYDQLYEALLDHRLKPGDRLNRRQVAEDLVEIGRASCRERV